MPRWERMQSKEEEEAKKEDLRRRMDEYLRLSAMAPYVEVVVEEEGMLPPPPAEEGPLTLSGLDLVAIIGMKGETAKAEARRAMDLLLADQKAVERLKAEPMEEPAAYRRETEEPNEDSETKQFDYQDWMARGFRDGWAASWSNLYGSYEDTTKLGPMRFTDHAPAPDCMASPRGTLQVFSIRLAGIRGGLQWPIDVFGMVAVRDNIDFNRNVIFSRTRDSCQTLTKEDRYLALAGPTRAVVWCDKIVIEVNLTVKGTTESEDKDLSFLAVHLGGGNGGYTHLFQCYETSKLSTLGLTLGYVFHSLEATIFVRVIAGSCFGGKFAASTTGMHRRRATRTNDHEEIVLHDSGRDRVLVDDSGEIQLARRVVSVEVGEELKLKVCVWKASEGEKRVVEELVFSTKKAGRSYDTLDAGFCEMQVTVAWSLLAFSR